MTRFQNNRHFLPARFYFRYHALVLAIVVCLLLIIEWALGARWSLFWPFIIIVPLALMALFKYFNPRSFEILMYFLHRLKSEQSARQYWEDLQYLKNQKENESANPSKTENP